MAFDDGGQSTWGTWEQQSAVSDAAHQEEAFIASLVEVSQVMKNMPECNPTNEFGQSLDEEISEYGFPDRPLRHLSDEELMNEFTRKYGLADFLNSGSPMDQETEVYIRQYVSECKLRGIDSGIYGNEDTVPSGATQ